MTANFLVNLTVNSGDLLDSIVFVPTLKVMYLQKRKLERKEQSKCTRKKKNSKKYNQHK